METLPPDRHIIAKAMFGTSSSLDCSKEQEEKVNRALDDAWMGLLENSGGQGVPVVINDARLCGYKYRICKLIKASRLFFFFQEYDQNVEDCDPNTVGYRNSISYRHTPRWDKPVGKIFRRRRGAYFTLYQDDKPVISTTYD